MYIELGLQEDAHLCVFIYGGQPPGEWELREENLPEGWVCVVCSGGKPIVNDKKLPSNFRLAKPDDFIPDMVRQGLSPGAWPLCTHYSAVCHVYAHTSMLLWHSLLPTWTKAYVHGLLRAVVLAAHEVMQKCLQQQADCPRR